MNNRSCVGEVVNVGSNKNIYIRNLANKIKKLLNSKKIIRQKKNIMRPTNSEVDNLRSNNNKIKKLSKWKPKKSLAQGLKITIEWYRKNIKKYSNKYTV